MNSKLTTYPNPDNRKKWTITAEINEPKKISLRFIPGKLMADHEGLILLLKKHALNIELTPEENSLNLIETVNNELVPKWLEVSYEHNGITIKIEDEQPRIQS